MKYLLVPAVILSAILMGLFNNSSVSAISDYDDIYSTVDELEVSSTYNDGTYDRSCDATDITDTWMDYILDESKWGSGNLYWVAQGARNSFRQALNDPNGAWGVSQYNDSTNGVKGVYVFWSNEGAGGKLNWRIPPQEPQPVLYFKANTGFSNANYAFILCDNYDKGGTGTDSPIVLGASYYVQPFVSVDYGDGTTIKNFFVHNTNLSLPSGYAGTTIQTDDNWYDQDNDDDGLLAYQEAAQGTSDVDMDGDTDNDGLSDLVESKWYTNHDAVFCDDSTPKNCAEPNPIQQDVYLEIDWMNDSVNSRTFKPTATQIALIEDAFADQDIAIHVDTGQFGGGEELYEYIETLHLNNTPGVIDFNEFRYGISPYAPTFSPSRDSIWRYMISGYNFAEMPGISGITNVGGSDIFVSYGLVKETFAYDDEDSALAGTIIHELGHTLCLSDERNYTEQPSECIYGGVDSYDIAYILYGSAMTYWYQLSTVDYSIGANGVADHNDWAGVKLGMGNFSGTKTALGKSNIDNKKVAIDVDSAPDDGMTAEMSQYIHNQKQLKNQSTEDNSTQQESLKTQDTKNIDTEATSLNNGSKEDEKKDDYQWQIMLVAGLVIFGGLFLILHKRIIKIFVK